MITSQDIRDLERQSGISMQALMESAGKAVCQAVKERVDLKNKKVLVVCYHGNNGGDGFVAAHHLSKDAETDVLFIGDEKKLRKEALSNYKRVEYNERVQLLVEDEVDFDEYDVIIDAMLGIGIQGSLNNVISAIVDKINNSKAYKVSIDIPTGLNPDTGAILDKCVNADLIVTFHDMKKGLEQFQDRIVIADIGLQKS